MGGNGCRISMATLSRPGYILKCLESTDQAKVRQILKIQTESRVVEEITVLCECTEAAELEAWTLKFTLMACRSLTL